MSISVIGIGRLGICTALCLEKAGFNVLGLDLSETYVNCVNDKTLKSNEPLVEKMLKESTNFKATTDLEKTINFSDVIFILVPTPTGTTEETTYDCTILNKVLSDINEFGPRNKHIVVCCTVMPTYIEKARELLKDCTDTTLSYNPEFIAQGNIIHGLLNPDMVLIGQGSVEAGDIIESIHRKMVKIIPRICRMSPTSAEITKLAVNCFITAKISYCNMISDIADNTEDANKYDILDAVGQDTRIGRKCLTPGFGYGGPCFPRDNRALGLYARSVGIDSCISDSTDKFNTLHAKYMADILVKKHEEIYVFEDVAYKPKCPVDIIEESHPLKVAKELVNLNKKVVIKDRESIIDCVKKEYGNSFKYVPVLNIPIHISHYKKLTDRRAYLEIALSNQGLKNVVWCDSIDRDTMSSDQLNMYRQDDARWTKLCNLWGDYSSPRVLSKAEIANAVTHINIYKHMIDNDVPRLLVLEDDCLLMHNFSTELSAILKELPEDFDVCFLGTAFNWDVQNYRSGFFGSQNKNEIVPDRRVYPIKGTHTADAYILSLKGAKKIYDAIVPFCLPIDYMMNPIFIMEDVKSYWCYPGIVKQGSFSVYKSSAMRPL